MVKKIKLIPGKDRSRTGPTALSLKRRKVFLAVLSRTGKVAEAARAVGYKDSNYLRRIYISDEEFAKQWDAAWDAASDIFEEEVVRRAIDGVREPQYYKGKVAGYTLKYSDQLLMFLLRAARPDKFADRRKIESTIEGRIGVAVLPMTAPSLEDWEIAALRLRAVQDRDRITVDALDAEFADVTPQQGTALKRT